MERNKNGTKGKAEGLMGTMNFLEKHNVNGEKELVEMSDFSLLTYGVVVEEGAAVPCGNANRFGRKRVGNRVRERGRNGAGWRGGESVCGAERVGTRVEAKVEGESVGEVEVERKSEGGVGGVGVAWCEIGRRCEQHCSYRVKGEESLCGIDREGRKKEDSWVVGKEPVLQECVVMDAVEQCAAAEVVTSS